MNFCLSNSTIAKTNATLQFQSSSLVMILVLVILKGIYFNTNEAAWNKITTNFNLTDAYLQYVFILLSQPLFVLYLSEQYGIGILLQNYSQD